MGLRLSAEKTLITHIDEGLDFLGWRIQRHRKRGTNRHYVYIYPARKALTAVTAKVKTTCRRDRDRASRSMSCCIRLNPVLRGWCAYFRSGCPAATFSYLSPYSGDGNGDGCAENTARSKWKHLRRRYCNGGWWPAIDERNCSTRRRYAPRGTGIAGQRIPSPWQSRRMTNHQRSRRGLWRARCIERCTPGSGSGPRKRTGHKAGTALRADFTVWSWHDRGLRLLGAQ